MLISMLLAAAVATPLPTPTPTPTPAGSERVLSEEAVAAIHANAAHIAHFFPFMVPEPSPRPVGLWSPLEHTPGVVLDRVNVGGSENALQPLVVWRGDAGTGTTWTLDGIDFSDPAAPGSSALFIHPELLRRVSINPNGTGVRTPGLAVTAEPANVDSLGTRTAGIKARLFVRASGAGLQSDNVGEGLDERSLWRADTRSQMEAGALVGRKLDNERAEVVIGGAWSRLGQRTFTEHDESHKLTSLLARASTRFDGATTGTFSVVRTEKIHDDRDTTFTSAPEARWHQSGPAWLVAATGSRQFGSTPLRAKVGYLDSTFRLDPGGGPDAEAFEDFRGVFQGSYLQLQSHRRRFQAGVESQLRRSLGTKEVHLLAGIGHRVAPVSTRSGWPGRQVIAIAREQVFFRTFRLTGFAQPTRDQDVRSTQTHSEAYLRGLIGSEGLHAVAGVRLDRLTGHNEPTAVGANPQFPALLPAMTFQGTPARFRWLDVLPRAELRWRSGLKRASLRYAAYGAALGSGDVTFDHPGREIASLTYYWRDRDGDLAVDGDELAIDRGVVGSSGFDPDRPDAPVAPHQIDAGLRAPRTHELSATFEADAHGRRQGWLTAYYRRLVHPLWRPLQNLTRADYIVRGGVNGRLFDDDYSVGYFAPVSASKIAPGNGRILTNREGYHQDTAGVELNVWGREAGWLRWRLWGSVQDWREYFDDADRAVQDPTPTESEPQRDGGIVTARAGGFGRGDVFVNARWTAGGLLERPLIADIHGRIVVMARDGFPVPYFHIANTGDPTAGSKAVLVAPLDRYRLPAVVELDLHLQRSWTVGGRKITLSADAFNALNRGTSLQVRRDVELRPGVPREILRPRIVRIGLDVEL